MRVAVLFFGIFACIGTIALKVDAATPALRITEIMYSPLGPNAGHEWIEVQNTGNDSIDLGAKDIRLFDGSKDHLIKATDNGTTLESDAIAVIAQNPDAFHEDWPNYSSLLLKSSFTLPAAATIGIEQTSGPMLAQAQYSSATGAKGDGNSLQLSGSTYVAGAPTPGVVAAVVPAPLAAPVKASVAHASARTAKASKSKSQPSAKAKGSKIRGTTSNSSALTDSAYDSGMTAPAASAITDAAGALLRLPWFAAFLALLAFSAFSLILIARTSDTHLPYA